jgi:hypothetical protein
MATLSESADTSLKQATIAAYNAIKQIWKDVYKLDMNNNVFPNITTDKLNIPAATAEGGRKKAPKSKGSKGRRSGGGEVEDISNIGDLVKDDNHPQGYVGSFGLNSLLSMPAASTAGMRISANSADLLPTNGFNLVDPPLRGGAKAKKTKRAKPKK